MSRGGWALALTLAVGALVMSGCGGSDNEGGDAMRLNWDVSGGHSIEAVDWPDADTDAVNLEPVSAVALTLPDGQRFSADKDVQRVGVTRTGDQVDEIRIAAQPASVDDAYRQAKAWAREFDLPLDKLDRWHAAGGPTEERLTLVGPPGRTIGHDGPEPSVEIIAAGDGQASVILNFAWA